MKVDFLGLRLVNPFWNTQMTKMTSKYFDFINVLKCSEQKLPRLYEDNPHITLLYKFKDKPGVNSLYCQVRIVMSELYEKLKSDNLLHLDNVIINTFDNEDSRVLKLDLSNCSHFKVLEDYNKQLVEKYGTESDHKEYNPHITLTYLNKDVTDDQLSQLISDIDLDKLRNFEISRFMMNNLEGSELREFVIK